MVHRRCLQVWGTIREYSIGRNFLSSALDAPIKRPDTIDESPRVVLQVRMSIALPPTGPSDATDPLRDYEGKI